MSPTDDEVRRPDIRSVKINGKTQEFRPNELGYVLLERLEAAESERREGFDAGVVEGIRQAREAIEAARPNTFDLNWAWEAVDALTRD